MSGKPFIMVVRGEDQKFINSKLAFIANFALRRARRVIVVSKVFLELMPQEFRNKTVFIPNGVDANFDRSIVSPVLSRYQLSAGSYLVSVGRILSSKAPRAFDSSASADPKS